MQTPNSNQPASQNHSDVLIIGAGLSGVGAGYHLQTNCPDQTYTILEGRPQLGGTWDLFRYPGIRSDSDMYTLGYSFKPWTRPKAIADGSTILDYIKETAEEYGIVDHIRFNHQMTAASWSSDEGVWTVTATVGSGQPEDESTSTQTFTCNYLFMCSGYYSYKGGYQPTFEGQENFNGPIVHPQKWPDELDYRGKRVAIIGSGATAMTLVPAMAADAEHVTMVQRSPTYVVSRPAHDPVAKFLRRFLPEPRVARLIRRKNIRLGALFYGKTRTKPEKVRTMLLDGVRKGLGEEYDVDTHFTPSYDPWDQRLCLIPDGDLYKAINSGQASVVTDQISHFTSNGIQMASGQEIEADIIITATGLQLVTLGEADFYVDGELVDFAKSWSYKGISYSDVPNLASTFGYINASWTLRSDMIAEFVCRVLNHMTASGTDVVVPRLRPEDADMTPRPWVDDFSSGYMKRMMPMLPRQGDRAPWLNTQSYHQDLDLIAKAPIDDGVLQFSRSSVKPMAAATSE